MSSLNHFELLEAEEPSVEIALRNYGWMGRKQFCLFLTGLLLMRFLCVTALRGAQSLTAVVLIVGCVSCCWHCSCCSRRCDCSISAMVEHGCGYCWFRR